MPKKLTDSQIQSIVSSAVRDAVDNIEANIAPDRIKAQRYYDGHTDLSHENGRSGVVATKLRDTVRAIKPSLMRVFLSSGRYVEYTPRGKEDVPTAKQATAYMHYKMEEKGGFNILADAIHDATLKKNGFVKVYYEEYDQAKNHNFTNLSENERQAIMMDEGVTVVAEELDEQTGLYDMEVQHQSSEGDICVEGVPPEEFFIDESARSIDDCYVCGHRNDMRLGDLVAMGYDKDIVYGLSGTVEAAAEDSGEDDVRRGYAADTDEQTEDKSMKRVMVTEAYMRVDIDGTGVPALHSFVLGGSAYTLLDYEPCDEIPFAVFEVDPIPHSFWGNSVADLLITEQDAATSMLRGALDNVAMVNNPRIAALDGQVNLDDLMNNEIGAIVREKVAGATREIATPFMAGQTLPMMQYFDSMIESKTGVTRASAGLDPDALQSTTRAGVNATIQAAAGQMEVMARNLAEGGMTRLFKLMLKLIVKNSDDQKMLRLNGEFKPIDPRVWDTEMDVSVNVGLGTGREEEKAAVLREILGLQMQTYQMYGPGNGVVGLENITNTVADIAASVGIRNPDRYFRPVTEEYEQQLMAQAQQSQGQSSDPAQSLIAAEQVKGQAQLQGKMIDAQVKSQDMMMKDDRERDKMAQDFALKAAAQESRDVNEAAVRAEQERNRYE